MLTPKDYIGTLMELGQDRRGIFKEMNYITEYRASIVYELPLAEVFIRNSLALIRERSSIPRLNILLSQMVGDFFDQLKSRSKGYASMEYSLIGYLLIVLNLFYFTFL